MSEQRGTWIEIWCLMCSLCSCFFSRKWEIHDTWSNANAFLAVIWCSMHWWPTTHENDIAIIFPRKNNFEPRESWGTDKVKLDQVYHKQICFCFKIWSACCYLPIIAIKAAFKLPRWRARPSPFLWKVTPMGEEKHTFRKKNAVQFPCRKIAVCNKPHGDVFPSFFIQDSNLSASKMRMAQHHCSALPQASCAMPCTTRLTAMRSRREELNSCKASIHWAQAALKARAFLGARLWVA